MWWMLSIVSAGAQVFRNAIMKDLGHRLDEYINVWGRFTFLLPFVLGISLYMGIPELKEGFWVLSFLTGIVITLSTLCLSKAFKYGHISMSIALWKIGVVILLILGIVFLGEKPTIMGVAGVFVVLAGVYILNIEKARVSAIEPIRLLFTEKGPRYALMAGVLLGPATAMWKQTLLMSDPFFSGFTNFGFGSLILLPVVLMKSRKSLGQVRKHLDKFVGMGVLAAGATVTGNIAYSLTVTAYVEGVKQIEVLFALVVGVFVFKEHEKVREIWPGCVVIILGVLLLIFAK